MLAFLSLAVCALGAVVGTTTAQQQLPSFCSPALAPIPVLTTPGLTLIQAQVVINNADRLQTDLVGRRLLPLLFLPLCPPPRKPLPAPFTALAQVLGGMPELPKKGVLFIWAHACAVCGARCWGGVC